MKRLLCIGLASLAIGCGPTGSQTPKDNFDADAKSGPDAKRSGAQHLEVNKPHTDEVSFVNQDRTDWYQVELKGKAGVLNTQIHWDNDNSDVRIDVFDEFGQEIAASPVRDKGAKAKKLLTQIDKVGVYFIRVTAPGRSDGTVYTMEAKWDQPPPMPVVTAPPANEHPMALEEDKPKKHAPREPREPREKPAASGESVQARILNAYREGNNLIVYIDKGSSAGIRVGATGNILQGASGEDPLEGGELRVTRVIDATKSMAATPLRSIGKNNRVTISVGK
jgi:hypothetical protein